jgi:pilus assembly protein Flp/PilA
MEKFRAVVMWIQSFLDEKTKAEDGQSLVEYALILVLIAIVVIVMLAGVGTSTNQVFSRINSGLATP